MLGQDAVIQVVKRVFPFDRGLFEARSWQSFKISLLVIGQLTSILLVEIDTLHNCFFRTKLQISGVQQT